MVEVGPIGRSDGGDAADLVIFADRLAAAGSDRPTALAHAHVRRAVEAGHTPPGLRRLAEALAASVAELTPAQRRPADEPGAVVRAVRDDALVVLEEAAPDGVAAAVAALVRDGRRVVVAAATPPELAAVRDGLPPALAAAVLDRLPAMPPAELRTLRALLATATPSRRARSGQRLPATPALPDVAEVAELCRRATRSAGPPGGSGAGDTARLMPTLLRELDEERLAAVTAVARCVQRSLSALPGPTEQPWVRTLLADLVYSRHRAEFDRMLEDTAQATTALEESRADPPVEFTGPLPAGAPHLLRRYLAHLEEGGRPRRRFPSAPQRDVAPVLRAVRVAGGEVGSAAEIRTVLRQVELRERLARIEADCVVVGVPAPRDPATLLDLSGLLVAVGAAARSIGALRHDVLFIHPNSPVAVPDVESARAIADAVVGYAEHGSVAEAGERLDRMAATLAGLATVDATAPEHGQAVAALRARDAQGYAEAVDALAGARREASDEQRTGALLAALRGSVPRLAADWAAQEAGAPLGFAVFTPIDRLLEAMPPDDSSDVLVLLNAPRLGVERLLLTAVAPRLIATAAPGERDGGAPSVLGVLQRAAALVIGGRPTGGRVVQFAAGGNRGLRREQAGA